MNVVVHNSMTFSMTRLDRKRETKKEYRCSHQTISQHVVDDTTATTTRRTPAA